MSDKKVQRCKYCGEAVTGNFHGYTVICDSDECNKEDADCEQQMHDDARWAAAEDDYSRYM